MPLYLDEEVTLEQVIMVKPVFAVRIRIPVFV